MLQGLIEDANLPFLIGGAVVVVTLITVFIRRTKRNSYLVDAPKDVLVLRQAPRGPYAPSLSPFPLKLETYLRMAKIPYKNVIGTQMSPRTGKTPWAQLNGEILTDSQFILEHVKQHFNIDTMSHLSLEEQSIGRAFQKMLEENTFWCLAQWRLALDPDMFVKKIFKIPAPMYWFLRYRFKKTLYGQGIGRHTPEVMLHITRGDLSALSAYLGDKKFLTGEDPCEVDCAIFGMLAQFKWNAPGSPLLEIMNDYPNLHAFCDRMKEDFWPDWDECITHGGTRDATK